MESMPLAVALLCHPAGSLAALLTSIVTGLYFAQSRRFLPAFTAASAASLALLGYLQIPPSTAGFAYLGLGVALLHLEFLWPTLGAAGLFGLCSAAWGSSLLLAPLPLSTRLALSLLAALVLLAAVAHTMRLRTLPR